MRKNNVFLLAIGTILFFVFHVVLSLTPLVANDFTFLSQSELSSLFSLPYAWWDRGTAGMGEYTTPLLWFWPMDVLYGFGSTIGLPFELLERILGILPASLLGVYGIRRLLKKYELRNTAIFCGSLIYILNTYFLLLVDGGQLTIAISYSWFPFVFLFFINAIKKDDFYAKLLAASSLVVLSVLDLRYVYIAGLLLGMYALYQFVFLQNHEYLSYFKKLTFLGVVAGITLTGVLAYMLVPLFFAQGANLPDTYGRVSQTSFLSLTTMGNAILLLQPHWYKNIFGNLTELRWEFIVFPILAFSAPLLNRKKRTVGFWLLISLIGIFLAKGSLEPLGQLYTWLFTYVPGFSLFRDSTKFFVLIALSYSILSAFAVNALIKKYAVVKKILPILVTCYLLLITFPVWSYKMTGILSVPRNIDVFAHVESILSSDSTFSRVLWLPTRASLGYASETHPSLEASRLVNLRPFAVGVVGSYELFNFLRDAPFMGEMLKVAGIHYISYPYPDPKREELNEEQINYYKTFTGQIAGLPWIGSQVTSEPIPIWKTKESKDHFFLAPNHYFVVGSDRIYNDLVQLPGFDLSKNALTFLEEYQDTADISKYSETPVVLYRKSITDLILKQIPKDKLVFPARDLPFNPNDKGWPASHSLGDGWWKREASDLISWRAFLQDKYGLDNLDFDYGGGISIAEGDRKLEIRNTKFETGRLLFARMMKSSKGGTVEFLQGDMKIGEVNTKDDIPEEVELTLHGAADIPDKFLTYDDANVSWRGIGELRSNEPVTIKTEGDVNVINALTTLSYEEYSQLESTINKSNVIDWDTLSENEKAALFTPDVQGAVTYQRISPVHYKVNVEGITQYQTLVFSETYDPLWELNGQKPVKVYSLLNGFQVEENGEYDLYFSAQKYVNIGLVLSGLTIMILIFLLLKYKKAGTGS